MIAALLAGVAAGLGVAMPVGAVATLLAVTSAQCGWRIGAAAGLGAATVDGLYATVALLFGALLAPLLEAWRAPLRWVAAAVLVAVGITLLRPAWHPAPATGPSSRRGAGGASRAAPLGARHAYATFLGLTVVNPTTVVYFAALTTGGGAGTTVGGPAAAAFVVGAFAASAVWQLVVAGAGAGAGRALTGPRGRRWTALAGGAVVVALAVRTALGA